MFLPERLQTNASCVKFTTGALVQPVQAVVRWFRPIDDRYIFTGPARCVDVRVPEQAEAVFANLFYVTVLLILMPSFHWSESRPPDS